MNLENKPAMTKMARRYQDRVDNRCFINSIENAFLHRPAHELYVFLQTRPNLTIICNQIGCSIERQINMKRPFMKKKLLL